MSHDPERKPESKNVWRPPGRPNALRLLRALLAKNGRCAGITEDHVLSVQASRRGREAVFGRDLFADPAWDILLELYAARLGDRRLTRCDLATLVDLQLSSLERWLRALAERGLVIATGRGPGETDVIELSESAATAMKRLMDYWGSAFRSI